MDRQKGSNFRAIFLATQGFVSKEGNKHQECKLSPKISHVFEARLLRHTTLTCIKLKSLPFRLFPPNMSLVSFSIRESIHRMTRTDIYVPRALKTGMHRRFTFPFIWLECKRIFYGRRWIRMRLKCGRHNDEPVSPLEMYFGIKSIYLNNESPRNTRATRDCTCWQFTKKYEMIRISAANSELYSILSL